MERSGDTFANGFEDLPEIVENIIWHLDAGSMLRAKQVCHLWKETIEHLERYKQLWRHICLRDIHRASLIDIIGFNPWSHDYHQEDVAGGDEADFEDLWKNVYKSWMAGQFLGRCGRSSFFKLTGVEFDYSYGKGVVHVGAYVYILDAHAVLSVWNIDTGGQALYSQSLRDKLNPRNEMYPYLQDPLCKFSQHQDSTQHSLIIPTIGDIQWWIFSNGEFHLAKILQVQFSYVRVWHNMLVTSDSGVMEVFILERMGNEFNFRARNVSEKFSDDHFWGTMNVWDNRCLLCLSGKPFTIAIYGLDDFQRQALVTGPVNTLFTENLRIFGDFVLTTIVDEQRKQRLYVFNTKNGDQFRVKISGCDVSTYKLHGDILIAEHRQLYNEVSICRINSSGRRDPVWCRPTDKTQGRMARVRVVLPEVLETRFEPPIHDYYRYISYGRSIVFLKSARNQWWIKVHQIRALTNFYN